MENKDVVSTDQEAMQLTGAVSNGNGCELMDSTSHQWSRGENDKWHTPTDPNGNVEVEGQYLNVSCLRCGLTTQLSKAVGE